jgi:hypothetical protein
MQILMNWLKGMFTTSAASNVPGRDLTGIPIFGGESGNGGFFEAFGTGGTGLLNAVGQISFLAIIIGVGLLFISLFLCVFGLVQASLEGDPRGVAEARTGLITCFVSIGLINMVPLILGIIYQIAGIK